MAEEPEDLNAFNSEDCGGAVLMLGIVPAVLNYVFNKEQMGLTITFGVGALLLAGAVYLLAKLTQWAAVGRVVNLVGCILVPAYVVIAVMLWMSPLAPTHGKIPTPEDRAAQQSPAARPQP